MIEAHPSPVEMLNPLINKNGDIQIYLDEFLLEDYDILYSDGLTININAEALKQVLQQAQTSDDVIYLYADKAQVENNALNLEISKIEFEAPEFYVVLKNKDSEYHIPFYEIIDDLVRMLEEADSMFYQVGQVLMNESTRELCIFALRDLWGIKNFDTKIDSINLRWIFTFEFPEGAKANEVKISYDGKERLDLFLFKNGQEVFSELDLDLYSSPLREIFMNEANPKPYRPSF